MTTRRLTPIVLVAAWALTAIPLAPGCGGPHGGRLPDARPPLAAPVGTAQVSTAAAFVEVAAGIEPFRRALPGTVLMGRVNSIEKVEGDRVRAGNVLARIASEDVTARRAQAEAALVAARAMEDNARQTRERMERLFARQAASRKNLEDSVAAHDSARAQREAAEEAVRAAAVYVEYATVRAPFDGIVARRNVERGDMATPAMPLFVVEDRSRMKLEAEVAESSAAELSAGTAVEVAVEALGNVPLAAVIHEVLPTADPRSRTFTVRVLLDNPDGVLRSGTFARLRLPRSAAAGPPMVVVPDGAVVRRGPLAGVFVVDADNVARLRWVTLGASRDGAAEVLTGLAAGERIVAAPPAELEDGRAVAGATETAR